MSDMTALKMATDRVEQIESDIVSLAHQLQQLAELKEAWINIRDLERKAAGLGLTVATQPNFASSPIVESFEDSSVYGAKTNSLRHHLLQAGDAGMTLFQIKSLVKLLGAQPNFAYRFVARMKESGELTEKGDRLIATPLMRENIKIAA